MPGPYGIVPTGFSAKTVDVILQEIEDDEHSKISSNLNVNTYTPVGQINGIIASKAGELWELGQNIVTAFDPDSATNLQEDVVCAITGTDRRNATFTTVDAIELHFTVIGTYAAGTLQANPTNQPNDIFVNVNDIVVTSVPVDVTNNVFRCLTAGPVNVVPGGLNQIAVPVTGWTGILDLTFTPVIGLDIESDAALRLRREAELAAAGSATDDAMLSGVSKVAGVISVQVFSNDTPLAANGIPPNSQMVVIYDNGGAANNDVAQAIWNNKSSGIAQVSSTAGTPAIGTATDSEGVQHTIAFTRVATQTLYLVVHIDVLAGIYVGDAAVEAALAAWATGPSGHLKVGSDVFRSKLVGVVAALAGVQDVTALHLGFAPTPALDANLPVDGFHIALLITANVAVTATTVPLT